MITIEAVSLLIIMAVAIKLIWDLTKEDVL